MFVSWGGTVCSLKRKPKYSERLLTNACAVVLRQFISGFTKAKCFILMIVTATVRTVKARKKRARVWHCKQNEKKLIISLITFLLCNDNRCKIRCVIMLFNQDEYKWTFYDDHRCTSLLLVCYIIVSTIYTYKSKSIQCCKTHIYQRTNLYCSDFCHHLM